MKEVRGDVNLDATQSFMEFKLDPFIFKHLQYLQLTRLENYGPT